jgi:hypothetical protein
LRQERGPAPKGDGARLQLPVAEGTEWTTTAAGMAQMVRGHAKKRGKLSVINIVAAQRPTEAPEISSFIQEEFEFVIGSLEIGGDAQLASVIPAVDGVVDVLLIDANPRPFLATGLAQAAGMHQRASRLLSYSDAELWARTVMYELKALAPLPGGARVVIAGLRAESKRLAEHLVDQGVVVVLSGAGQSELAATASALGVMNGGAVIEVEPDLRLAVKGAAAIAAFHKDEPLVNRAVMAALDQGTLVFDATIGAVELDAIQEALDRGIRIVRPDMRAAVAGELAAQLGIAATATELMGRAQIAGWPVVAGGLVGALGDIVVDSITNPKRVVGVADGRGRIVPGGQGFEDRIRMVESALAGRQALLHS